MEEEFDSWYIITDWRGTRETTDKEAAKDAIRDGGEVGKIKRIIFEQGPTTFRMTALTDIYKIKDL